MAFINSLIDFLNNIFWGYILIYGLLGVGIFFTLRLGFIQFVHFGEMIRVLKNTSTDTHGVTPFQALTTSLASRVGTGNIAGVAVALYLGGAGAIFWMWMVALVGMATAYAESTLAQLYKVEDESGQYRGGPAFYISKGLNMPKLGIVFSACLMLAFGLIFNAVQANSIASAMNVAFGTSDIAIGITLALAAGVIIFGGVKSIGRFSELVIPLMAGIYVLLAAYVVAINITDVPAVLVSIVSSAFGLEEAAGGIAGSITAAMLNGIKRGLFSNEAGMGSAPNAAATAVPAPHHPSAQGFVQAFGVFIDTIVICTATALIILLSGVLEPGSGISGVELTQLALNEHIGEAGKYFIAIAILFFAFTSIVANYSYAENSMVHFGFDSKIGMTCLRLFVMAMVVWGSVQSVSTVFNAADAAMGLMASINLFAILLLSNTVHKLTKDYLASRKAGLEPDFKAENFPELKGKIDAQIWK